MTIYEVMYQFLEFFFPSVTLLQYADLLDLTAFIMTYIFIFGFIVIPLYQIATYFFRLGKKI